MNRTYHDCPALAGILCHVPCGWRCDCTATILPRSHRSPRLLPPHRGSVSLGCPGYTKNNDEHDLPAVGPGGYVYDAPVRSGGLP